MSKLAPVLDIGLAFLVYLSPFLLLVVLIAALCGTSQVGRNARRCRPPLPVEPPDVFRADERPAPVLVSDAERDEALQTVSQAVGEGRLTFDEAEGRVEAVLRCSYRHHLDELVSDLPACSASTRDGRRGRSRVSLGLFAAATVSVLAAVLAQSIAGVWELWPVALAGCCLWAARPRGRTP